MFQIRGPTWRTTAPGDRCPILQKEMVMAVGYTKSRVVPDSSLKWRNKHTWGRQSLDKEAELWRLGPCPSPPAPIPHSANWILVARGHKENEALRKREIRNHSFSAPALEFRADAGLPGVLWKEGRTGESPRRHVTALRSRACPGLGLFPPHQLPSALCLLSVFRLDHFSETKALHLTCDQGIVRFLSLPLMTVLQQPMILRSSGIKKVRFIHSPILKTYTWNTPF